jgi:hypothetical protein
MFHSNLTHHHASAISLPMSTLAHPRFIGALVAVQYAVQFPGEPTISGEYLPPAEGALAN